MTTRVRISATVSGDTRDLLDRGKVVAVEIGVRPAHAIRALALKHLLGNSAP